MPITKESVAARRKKKAAQSGKDGGKSESRTKDAVEKDAAPVVVAEETVRFTEPRREEGIAVMRQPAARVKDWAPYELCDREFGDVRNDLQLVFGTDDGLKFYCIAILRACREGLKLQRLASAYEKSFLSEFYPGVTLTRKTVERLFRSVGKKGAKVQEFMRLRAGAAGEKRALLVSWTDRPNVRDIEQYDLLPPGRNGRKAAAPKDRSVLYAYDLGAMEPVCAKRFRGEEPDGDTVKGFLEENGIKGGFVLSGKLPHGDVPGMNYLVPSKRVQDMNGTASYSGGAFADNGIGFRKWRQGKNGKWIYCFTRKDASNEKAAKAAWKQGVCSFESALDIPPEEVWKALNLRKKIRKSMHLLRAAADFEELTGAGGTPDSGQEGLSAEEASRLMTGSEFCDYLSMLLTARLARAYAVSGLRKKWTYREVQEELTAIRAVKVPGGSWELAQVSSNGIELLRKLLLLDLPAEPEPAGPEGGNGGAEEAAAPAGEEVGAVPADGVACPAGEKSPEPEVAAEDEVAPAADAAAGSGAEGS